RLRGWRFLAAAVDAMRDRLRQEGVESVLAANSWSIPGELGFYCTGHPTVYSLGLALGDRWSQYDFWRPNPVRDPEAFGGQTFIFVGGLCPVLHEAFEYVEPPLHLHYQENGHLIACWDVIVCRGFRGFAEQPASAKKF